MNTGRIRNKPAPCCRKYCRKRRCMYYTLAVIALLIITFLPRVGLLALLKSYRAAQKREKVEDALKHLLDRERNGRHASPESLGGKLDLPRAKVLGLIEDMEV